MSEVIETTVYRLDELSDAAKEKARAWYRQVGFDHDWYEFVYEDFQLIAEILGLRLKTAPVRVFGGGTRQKPRIWFSGFWSQGDGACFEGQYSHIKGAPKKIREHAPKDSELHRIYILRDDDPAGDGARDSLVERANAAGIEAIVISPQLGDFNEDIRALGLDALRSQTRVQIGPQDVARFMALAA